MSSERAPVWVWRTGEAPCCSDWGILGCSAPERSWVWGWAPWSEGVPGCPQASRAFAEHLPSRWGSAARGTAAAVTLGKDEWRVGGEPGGVPAVTLAQRGEPGRRRTQRGSRRWRRALEGAPGAASWLPKEGPCQLRASLCGGCLRVCNLLLLGEFGCSRLGQTPCFPAVEKSRASFPCPSLSSSRGLAASWRLYPWGVLSLWSTSLLFCTQVRKAQILLLELSWLFQETIFWMFFLLEADRYI